MSAIDLIVRESLDKDAAEYCRRSGASDKQAINAFVRGVKQLGLWDKMVCWPLRRQQNSGTNTAYSLGGLGAYDGTLTNGPVWTTDGITKANAIEIINVTGTDSALRAANSVFACYKSSDPAQAQQRVFNCQGGTALNNWWQIDIGTTAAYVFETRNSVNSTPFTVSLGARTIQFNFFGSARADTTAQQMLNGVLAAQQTGLSARNPTGTPNVDMIGTVGAANARGTLSFAVAVAPTISNGEMVALYNLYKSTLGAGLGLPDYDPATIEYAARSGATDLANIDAFVRGVKDLGLWDSMVCWPLRSTQNAGTGDTVYSLGGLGTFDGTLVNEPSWGADGISFAAASSQNKTDALGLPTYPMSKIVVGQRVSGSGNASWDYRGTGSGATRSFAKRAYANNSMGTSIVGVAYVTLVSANAQTLTDNFEVATAIISDATNANGEVFINTTKPTQTAGAATWGTNASTAGLLTVTDDLVFRASFHATFASAVNCSAFYTLYKSTLGAGLSLP